MKKLLHFLKQKKSFVMMKFSFDIFCVVILIFGFMFYRDGYLDQAELENLLSDLFADGGQSYSLSKSITAKFMQFLDVDKVFISLCGNLITCTFI